MHIVNGKVLLVGCLGIIAVRDVKDVVRHILLHHNPGTTAKAHALTLADGVKP